MVQNSTGFTLTDHDLVMKGVCKDCKKKLWLNKT
jgi:Fe2+ or Zn2+ uptake regulation protein